MITSRTACDDMRMLAFYVFFFQAEDGIRDVAVTGVQTCALPILLDPTMRRDCVVRGVSFNPSGFTLLEVMVVLVVRSEEHTSELQSRLHLVCRLLLEKKKKKNNHILKYT